MISVVQRDGTDGMVQTVSITTKTIKHVLRSSTTKKKISRKEVVKEHLHF